MLKDQRGVILIFIVLVIGGIGLSISAMLTRTSLTNFLDANDALASAQVRAKVFGCLDEAIIQIQNNSSFAPATISTGSTTCTLSVTGSTTKTVTVSLTEGTITRSVQATINTSPFAVTQILEP